MSRDKEGILALSQSGLVIEKAADVAKNPYVFEFLDLEEKSSFSRAGAGGEITGSASIVLN